MNEEKLKELLVVLSKYSTVGEILKNKEEVFRLRNETDLCKSYFNFKLETIANLINRICILKYPGIDPLILYEEAKKSLELSLL